MENTTNNDRLNWLKSPLSERDLEMAAYLFKYIEKYGLEATKAEIAFERAKRNLLEAYERKVALFTK